MDPNTATRFLGLVNEPPPHEVIEYRGAEEKTVESVEDPTRTEKQAPRILSALGPLDERLAEIPHRGEDPQVGFITVLHD